MHPLTAALARTAEAVHRAHNAQPSDYALAPPTEETTPMTESPAAEMRAAEERVRMGDRRIDIALRGPIADWLDESAEEADEDSPSCRALAVARAINGKQPRETGPVDADTTHLEDHSENSSHPGETLKTARQTPGGNAEDCARRARYTTALVAAYTGPPAGRADRMAVAAMDLADHEMEQLRAERLAERHAERNAADAVHEAKRAERAEAARACAVQRADQLAATLREVLNAFSRATVAGQTAFYQAVHPIAPDDFERWHAALDQPPGPAATCGKTTTHKPHRGFASGPNCPGTPGPAATQATEPYPAIGLTNWTPPPPGDTREQLPPHILALIRPYLRGYTSTACQTAGYLAEAAADQPDHRDELIEWRQRMDARCRTNQKYTGEICPRHPKEPTP